ncbi:MAG: S9 family peptidase [Halieaceae bacterium]|jgi:oligopeptidase B|nr:S9 family peptidase [Halieaceae bacterium]
MTIHSTIVYASLISVLTLFGGCTTNSEPAIEKPGNLPPIAKKVPHELISHGESRIDNYYWMRDDSRTSPEVISHLVAENAYTQSQMAHTTKLQEILFTEISNRVEKNERSAPYRHGSYWYYNYFQESSEYPIYARKKETMDASEEIYLDKNKLASDHSYYSFGDKKFSSNEQLLAWSDDTLGRNIFTIHVKDMRSGELLSDTITGTSGSIMWANDNQTFFYINKDLQTLLGYQVFRHQLGTKQSEDVLVYEEIDTSFYTDIAKSRDNSTLFIYHQSTMTSGASVLDANTPEGSFQTLQERETNHRYFVTVINNWYYIASNWQAKNYRIMRVDKNNIGDKKHWQEIIPHKLERSFSNVLTFDKALVTHEKVSGQNHVKIYSLTGEIERELNFPEKAFYVGFVSNPETSSQFLRVEYSSHTQPDSILQYTIGDGSQIVLKQKNAGSSFDTNNYSSERIFVSARDGKKVPVSLVYRKELFKKDGSNPLLQYAYGAYGDNEDPYFDKSIVSLLDRGFVYAIAHIRGSSFLGTEWFDDGKVLNKKNSFNDFIDVSKGLVAQKYAHKNKIFAAGGSAGGLLMGGVVNMAPELFRGVIAWVPFVDVVTTMEDDSIPLTSNEYGEWGNPAIKEQYNYLMSYSPYDQVRAKNYPNLLVTTGLHDSQVQYFEPMKWVAKLREMKTDSNKLLFRIDMESGHGGASGRYKAIKETAMEYAFLLDLLGIEK